MDNLGCWDTATVHVTEPDLIQVSVSIIENVSCYDSANGELAAIVTGGTAPFSYSWNTTPIQTTQTATNLIAGFYSVTVTDTNLCPSAISPPEEITQPDSLYISALTFTAVLCNGENTGTATVVANGGTPNYSYAWSSGSPNDVAPNLIAGNYIIQISDINGCSRDSNIVVTQPDALSASYIGGEVSCIGGSDGWATVVVNGGVGPFNYLWENGTTLATISLVPEDWYTVTITDANLCVLIDSVNILDPLQPFEIDSLIITEITCRHADNGTITVLATGGQLPYLYSNTNGQNMQSNIGFIGLAPNTYSMYVEDANGCWDTASVTFVNPDSLYIDNVVFSNVSCFGMADDTIHAINAVGGTPPYEYSVGIGAPYHANLASFNGYGPGTYSVNVLDAHNCGAQYFITITEPDELEVTITTSNWWFGIYQIQCNGDSSGTATISASAGVGPYIKTVLDINGDTVVSSTNSNISGLTAGTYTFVIMDANGCTYTETIIYTEPLPIIHNFIATQISCTDSSTGSIIDSVWGGVGNVYTYSYSWNTGDNTYSLDSLDTGTYIITVVDQIGCISIDTCIINDTNALTLTVTNWVDVSCYDYCDGLITVEASGGMPNINSSGVPVCSYQWDDILLQTDTSAIGLCVDNGSNSTTYSCVVTDIQECTATVNYTLIQPDSLNVTVSTVNEISCYLDIDGKLKATVTGGTAFPSPALPYMYTWNNGTITAINNNLSVGSYVVVVEDSHGCMDTTEWYLSQPSVLSIDTIYETDVSCFGFGDGTITVDATGGTVIGIQEYIYTWSNGVIDSTQISTATGLLPGIYTVTAEDANGCTITSQSVYIDQPDTNLTFSIDVTDEICGNDGSATILVDGGTPGYTYEWNGPNGYTSTSSTADNLVPGSAQDPLWYTVDVTDTNGCTISGETFVNGIHEIFLPGFDTAFSVTVCLGEPVILPIQVKDSLFYVWMYDNDTIFSANSKSYIDDITVIPTQPDTNIYTLYFSNSSCTDSVKATILTPSAKDPKIWSDPSPDYVVDKFGNRLYLEAQIRNGESIDVFSDNMNLDTYQWHWSGDGETIQLATQRVITDFPAVTGWYYLEVYTEGCLVGFDSLKVVVGVAPYNAITPNADGSNDTWKIPGIKAYPNALIQVFNRWGSLVYEASGGPGSDYVAWDGTSDGKELPVGTYYYIIDLKTGDDLQTGPITIIR